MGHAVDEVDAVLLGPALQDAAVEELFTGSELDGVPGSRRPRSRTSSARLYVTGEDRRITPSAQAHSSRNDTNRKGWGL